MRNIAQNCPFCSNPAEYCSLSYDGITKVKHFFCKSCTEFVISFNAESRITSKQQGEFSDSARNTTKPAILNIFVPAVQQSVTDQPKPAKAEIIRLPAL